MVNGKVEPAEELDHERVLQKAILHRMNSMFYKTRIGKASRSVHAQLLHLPSRKKSMPPLHEHGLRTPCRGGGQPRAVASLELPADRPDDLLSRLPPDYLVPNVVFQWRRTLR
jgi:hypothetical protein